jgi:tetratricopeptide (TPR) repeat protein
MGHFEEAAEWYEKARKHFEAFTDDVWKIFYSRGFGDIALASRDFGTASKHYLQSLELARETRHEWAAAYALSGLGRCKLGLGNWQEARGHFMEAMQYGFETGDRGILLSTLSGYAELLYQEGKLEVAAQVASLVSSHYATWRQTRELLAHLFSALKESMVAAEFEQAQEKGQALDLQETVGNLIDWQKPQMKI